MPRAARINGSLYERFVAKVQIDRETGCWTWTAATANGYGVLGGSPTPRVLAHRFSYEHHIGPIAAGNDVHHACENRLCVNPSHLVSLTKLEHARLSVRAQRTHCKRGHEFTPDNLHSPKSSRWRQCKTCHREAARARYHGLVWA